MNRRKRPMRRKLSLDKLTVRTLSRVAGGTVFGVEQCETARDDESCAPKRTQFYIGRNTAIIIYC